MSEKTVTVSRAWYERALALMNGKDGCPFCGSTKPPVEEKGDENFLPRKGCADCDEWWSPKELRPR